MRGAGEGAEAPGAGCGAAAGEPTGGGREGEVEVAPALLLPRSRVGMPWAGERTAKQMAVVMAMLVGVTVSLSALASWRPKESSTPPAPSTAAGAAFNHEKPLPSLRGLWPVLVADLALPLPSLTG